MTSVPAGPPWSGLFVRAKVFPPAVASLLRRSATYVTVRETVYEFVLDHRDAVSLLIHREPPVRRR